MRNKSIYINRFFWVISIFFTIIIILTGCSINQLALNAVADMLSGDGGTTFTGDEDPELIGDSLPFALKLYESLLEGTPNHKKLLLATGKAFALYANAYVQTPADMLPDDEPDKREKMLARAKKLYIRGRDYILKALYLQVPGFQEHMENKDIEAALALIKEPDLPCLFWSAAAWMGAFSTDAFDMQMLMESSDTIAMIERVVEIDDGYETGSAHELLISYYGSLPAAMGGTEEKARFHFDKAIEYGKGNKAGPYLNLAASVCVNKQYIDEFQLLLEKVLSLETSNPGDRLLNELAREKAAWMLEHIENWFLIDTGEFDDEFDDDFDTDTGESGDFDEEDF